MERQIAYSGVDQELFAAFPDFKPDALSDGLPYVVAGDFTRYLFDAWCIHDRVIYLRGLAFIEDLQTSRNKEVRNLATVGYLESIQNTWPQKLLKKNIPYADLGPESKKWWGELNLFWDKRIRFLGESFQ